LDGKAAGVPQFQFDPTWPKPLPNKWAVGDVVGAAVDSKDHVWIAHRTRKLTRGYEDQGMYDPPEADCCIPAPGVIEFDQQGNVVQAWGGPGPDADWPKSEFTGKPPNPRLLPGAPSGYNWPESEHTVFVDYRGNVWVGNNGGSHILKFTRDGKFLLQIGHNTQLPAAGQRSGRGRGAEAPIDSNDVEHLGRPAGIDVDPKTNEVYIADGYGNRRVIVFDADTGIYKRHWGAYGNKPDDKVSKKYDPDGPLSQQFNLPHCVRIGADDLVYVCDRGNNRIQVFKKDGTFVKEAVITPRAMRGGVMDITFSPDPEQRFLYVADGRDEKVWILRRRDLQILGSFGHGGHFGGALTVAHNIVTDSRGNLYVAETLDGRRIQRFKYVGMERSVK
jgi:DNA-binding beta-propeller fold protein YncE